MDMQVRIITCYDNKTFSNYCRNLLHYTITLLLVYIHFGLVVGDISASPELYRVKC